MYSDNDWQKYRQSRPRFWLLERNRPNAGCLQTSTASFSKRTFRISPLSNVRIECIEFVCSLWSGQNLDLPRQNFVSDRRYHYVLNMNDFLIIGETIASDFWRAYVYILLSCARRPSSDRKTFREPLLEGNILLVYMREYRYIHIRD